MKQKAKKPARNASPDRKATPNVAGGHSDSGKEGELIGQVTHYFSNIKVAVIKVSVPLKVGDNIRIIGGEKTDFNQEVSSMQIDHEAVKSAKRGNSIGMKVKKQVREGYKIYKI